MQYYDLQKHWTRHVEPYLADEDLTDILVNDMTLFTEWQWGCPFDEDDYPAMHANSDWQWPRKGRPPRYLRYVAMGCCHWLVNFNLTLAMKAHPSTDWRIITSNKHSTVWDGEDTLFEMNFLAFGVPAQECFDLAYDNGEVLAPGQLRRTKVPVSYSEAA
jgi:hypothetical protein